MAWRELVRQRRIIWALSLRELATRYGRENLGFLWVIIEPLMFCASVSIMWGFIKPPYDHGIRVVPFTVTGYMPILLVRHVLLHGMYAARVNAPLLYHRQVGILQLFFARAVVETLGVTFAFLVIAAALIPTGLLPVPQDILLVYGGWFLLACMGFGLAMMFGSLFEIFEPVERIVSVISYIMVPASGLFYMASWVPERYRGYVTKIPFLNCEEMIRGGFFGETVKTYYDVPYTIAWAGGFVLAGLILATFVRGRVHVE